MVEMGLKLPPADVEKLVSAIALGTASVRMLRAESAGGLRRACSTILEASPATPLTEIGGVLEGASKAGLKLRNRIDVAWTGPDIPGSNSRLTSSVVASLVDEATLDVYLISYAMHSESSLTTALGQAIGRGVKVTVLYERREDNPGFSGWAVPFRGLELRRLCWPLSKRPVGASMHAKALVVDRRICLIGSANITDTAMMKNLELGVIIRDQLIARGIVESIENLISQGVLVAFSA